MIKRGLCANRSDHRAHLHDSGTLGRFWCTANQDDREPMRSERRREQSWKCLLHPLPGQRCHSMCGDSMNARLERA